MNLQLSLLSLAVLAAVGVAQAQSGSTATTTTGASVESRAAVKADAKAARQDPAASNPIGQRTTANQDKGHKPAPSVESRAAVKADAKAAKQEGNKPPEGQQSTKDQHKGGVQGNRP
jgi:hypothetical protein